MLCHGSTWIPQQGGGSCPRCSRCRFSSLCWQDPARPHKGEGLGSVGARPGETPRRGGAQGAAGPRPRDGDAACVHARECVCVCTLPATSHTRVISRSEAGNAFFAELVGTKFLRPQSWPQGWAGSRHTQHPAAAPKAAVIRSPGGLEPRLTPTATSCTAGRCPSAGSCQGSACGWGCWCTPQSLAVPIGFFASCGFSNVDALILKPFFFYKKKKPF